MEESTTGLTKNAPKLIEATANMGSDAFLKEISDAKDGTVAAVNGPDQVILDTDYFPVNEFVGVHHLDVTWFSSLVGIGGMGLVLEYWQKDQSGDESLVLSVDVPWHDNISDEFGNSGGEGIFHRNRQYRFVIKSHSNLSDTNWVGVDFLRIIFEDHWKPSLITVYSPNTPPFNPVNLSLDATFVNVTKSTSSTSSASATVSMPYDCTNLLILGNTNASGFICSITSRNTTGFTVTVEHKDSSTSWSGTIGVSIMLAAMTYSLMS